jgi:hypothetical protein
MIFSYFLRHWNNFFWCFVNFRWALKCILCFLTRRIYPLGFQIVVKIYWMRLELKLVRLFWNLLRFFFYLDYHVAHLVSIQNHLPYSFFYLMISLSCLLDYWKKISLPPSNYQSCWLLSKVIIVHVLISHFLFPIRLRI